MRHVGRYGGRNHVCNIWWLSVKGCEFGQRGNFALSRWLEVLPLQHYYVTTWYICGLPIARSQNNLKFKTPFSGLSQHFLMSRPSTRVNQWTFLVLRSTYSWRVTIYAGKPSAMSANYKPTPTFILAAIRCRPPQLMSATPGERYEVGLEDGMLLLFAGKTVWSIPKRIENEVLTKWRYINPLPFFYYCYNRYLRHVWRRSHSQTVLKLLNISSNCSA